MCCLVLRHDATIEQSVHQTFINYHVKRMYVEFDEIDFPEKASKFYNIP